MGFQDVLFYTLLLVGAVLGIGIGIFVAFDTAFKKTQTDADTQKHKTNGQEPVTAEGQKKKKRNLLRMRKAEAREKKLGKETETHRTLRERVEARNLSSYNDAECDFLRKDPVEAISEKREASNESYRYLTRK